MKQSQESWVIEKLEKEGKVSRNDALRNYFSRLGARVNDLKNAGWKIEGRNEKTLFGKDYVYFLIEKPKEL